MASNVKFSKDIQYVEWKNATGSDVSSGAIVKMGALGNATLAVALEDIANGASGSVGYNCAVISPKVSAAVFKTGESLIWDSSAAAFDDNQATPAAGDVSGVAARAHADGANGETTAIVFLTGIPGTLTA